MLDKSNIIIAITYQNMYMISSNVSVFPVILQKKDNNDRKHFLLKSHDHFLFLVTSVIINHAS